MTQSDISADRHLGRITERTNLIPNTDTLPNTHAHVSISILRVIERWMFRILFPRNVIPFFSLSLSRYSKINNSRCRFD